MADIIRIAIGTPAAEPANAPSYTEVDLNDPIGPSNTWDVVTGAVLGFSSGDLSESGPEMYLHAGGGGQPRAILQGFSLFSVPEVGAVGSASVLGSGAAWQWKVLSVD